MPTITLNGKPYEYKEGQTVLQVALENGIDIPYFCYHRKLNIAGNCRMCLVEVEGSRKPEISCNLGCRDGMSVKTHSPMAEQARKAVLEFILINHPLDCPVCDKAGECLLQDQFKDHSSVPSRFEDHKNHKPKVTPLGDLVMLDDERCILCTRCVRFCADVAKHDELCIINRGDHSELTTFTGDPMTNPYQLNTVDLCPVGALTSRDFRFQKRVWFLTSTPSVCTGCATGCNMTIDHHEGVVYRYMPRDNEAVNQCWLCDEGRLSYKFINDDNRIMAPYVRKNGQLVKSSWKEALDRIAAGMEGTKTSAVTVALSAQCTNEENMAWHYLANDIWKSTIAGVRREVKNPTHDEFLRDADKNPNSRALAELKVKSLADSRPEVLFSLDALSQADADAVRKIHPKMVVVLASNDVASLDYADVVLPKATFAEQNGSFTNKQGMVQSVFAAFESKGSSMPAWQIAARVASHLNIVFPFDSEVTLLTRLKEVFPFFAASTD